MRNRFEEKGVKDSMKEDRGGESSAEKRQEQTHSKHTSLPIEATQRSAPLPGEMMFACGETARERRMREDEEGLIVY
jgi:hypothetical protein